MNSVVGTKVGISKFYTKFAYYSKVSLKLKISFISLRWSKTSSEIILTIMHLS